MSGEQHVITEASSRYLEKGWYRVALPLRTECAAVLLESEAIACFLELPVDGRTPVFVKLAAGEYNITVLQSKRFGRADGLRPDIHRLNRFETFAFYAAKAWALIREGRVRGILRNARLALGTRSGFGAMMAQEGGDPSGPSALKLGPIARHELACRDTGLDVEQYASRLQATQEGPVFALHSGRGDRQIYSRWAYTEAVDEEADFDVYVANDAVLAEDALLILAEQLRDRPEVLLIYADEWIGGTPTAKFGFDPHIYSSPFSLGNLFGIRRGCGIGPHSDLTLLRPDQVMRVPVPLSTASRLPAVTPSLKLSPPSDASLAAVVPTRDHVDLLEVCIDGLMNGSEGVTEIIVVDNGSVEPRTFAFFERIKALGVTIIRDDGDFNFSRLCNRGAAATTSEVLAFINNDIKVIGRDWLAILKHEAVGPDIGAVGTRLFYADDTLQHGGISLGLSGCAGHLYRGLPRRECETVATLAHPSMRMAVTAACLVVARSRFEAVGGFDEVNFPVTLNDVDLCLRLAERGWKTLYVPAGEAYHLESKSRGEDVTEAKRLRRASEITRFRERWGHVFGEDIWASPALSSAYEFPHLR